MNIGIVGATGLLGREIVARLADSSAELREEVLEGTPPTLFATGNNAGETFPWIEDEDLAVEAYSAEAVRGLDLAIVAVPAPAAPPILARLRELGIPALDASRASRATAPFFFEDAFRPTTLVGAPVIALPTPESLALARLVSALQSFEITGLRATILKAASAGGQPGIKDLADATGKLLNGQEPETPLHGHRLAFNVIPQAGAFIGAETEAEQDLARDLERLVGRALRLDATIGWGPWFYGDFLSLSLALSGPAHLDELRSALTAHARIKVLDDPSTGVYPMPALATGDDALLVGRLRPDPLDPKGVRLIAAFDGTRATAEHVVTAITSLARARRTH